MSDIGAAATNVVRFRALRSPSFQAADQHRFLDAVYAAGFLPIEAADRATKAMATRLTIFGFVVIDEMRADGSLRRLRPSEAIHACTAWPWRVSKPSGRYRVDDDLPDTDRDLFAALQA